MCFVPIKASNKQCGCYIALASSWSCKRTMLINAPGSRLAEFGIMRQTSEACFTLIENDDDHGERSNGSRGASAAGCTVLGDR